MLTELNYAFANISSDGKIALGDPYADVALTDQSRTIFADSCLQFILQYGFNVVDLDWEYPVSGGKAGNINRPEDKQNFTLLIEKIRQTFDAQCAKDGKKYFLSIAGDAGKSYAANTELNLILQYVDYIQLMTYDLHGEWDTLTGLKVYTDLK
jgi:chitinase